MSYTLQVALREAHEDAVQKSLAAYNASAVGTGSARLTYEKLLQTFVRKAFEVKGHAMILIILYHEKPHIYLLFFDAYISIPLHNSHFNFVIFSL